MLFLKLLWKGKPQKKRTSVQLAIFCHPPAGSQHRENGIFTACYSDQYSAQYSVQCTVGDTIGALENGFFTGLGRGWGLQKFSEPAHEAFFGRTRPAACPKTASVCRFWAGLVPPRNPTPRSKWPWVLFVFCCVSKPPVIPSVIEEI